MIRARRLKKIVETKEENLDPVLEEQERMEVWKLVLEQQLLLHHKQIKVEKKTPHTVLNKDKRVSDCRPFLS